jgi:hypothetical protein
MRRLGVVMIVAAAVAFSGTTPVSAAPRSDSLTTNTKTCRAAAKSQKPTTKRQMNACGHATVLSVSWTCSDGSTLRAVPVKFNGVAKLVALRVKHKPTVWPSTQYTQTDVETACGGAI